MARVAAGQSQSPGRRGAGWHRQGRRPWRWSYAGEDRHRQASRLCHNSKIGKSILILRSESRVRWAKMGQNTNCDTASSLDDATHHVGRLCVRPSPCESQRVHDRSCDPPGRGRRTGPDRTRKIVPQGRPRIARRFNGGCPGPKQHQAPEGRKNAAAKPKALFRPRGDFSLRRPGSPAINQPFCGPS